MKINFSKVTFSPAEIDFVLIRLSQAEKLGYVRKRYEDNIYLLRSYSGVEEKGISPKWNVKIYRYSDRRIGHSIVCVDFFVLEHLVEENYDFFIPPDLHLLRIDDAGWGFPLCGVMVGVSDEKIVKTETVPIEYFKKGGKHRFTLKKYLAKYADLAVNLIDEFQATPESHRIEICSGYINQPLREKLRRLGFDVRVVEIKGLLQERLENFYKKYVFLTVGADIYYDPKDMKKSDIPKAYYRCLQYGLKHCPEQIKTGWQALQEI
ncbi:hypothetical protein JW935_26385 [candidate division KSB1 bacterium]|nr:hypothetical protein [candidate division KSB1 bacterium]